MSAPRRPAATAPASTQLAVTSAAVRTVINSTTV